MSMHLNNWMKDVGDETSLKDINIPGTHDSATQFCQFSLFSSCQKKSIKDLLTVGVRALDIRVDESLNLVHAFCKSRESLFGRTLTLRKVIGDILGFLSENPTETVIMLFKMDNGSDSRKCFRLFYENFILPNPEKWCLKESFPTMGEARGKIILIRRTSSDYEKSGIDFTSMPDHGNKKEFDSSAFSPDGKTVCRVQDRYNLRRKIKWEKSVNPLLEESEKHRDSFIVNYLSTAGFPFIPRFNSAYINRKFLSFPLEKGNHYGLLMLDFADKKITEKVIFSNNL